MKNIAKGFTLIELMVVIAIIAILASIIIPNMQRAREQAKLTACIQNIKSISTAMQMFMADNQGNTLFSDEWYDSDVDDSPLVPDYLGRSPVCPSWNQDSGSYNVGMYEGAFIDTWCNAGMWYAAHEYALQDGYSWGPEFDFENGWYPPYIGNF
ncbi:MAG: type II secretion system protein [Vulcanimicrobiota bacterium]